MTAFYLYIIPGLMDPENAIPFYQVITAAVYLIGAFSLPLFLIGNVNIKNDEVKFGS